MHLNEQVLFRKGGAYGMILWTKGLFVLVLCKRLASHPFHTLFSCNTSAHTHLPPTLHTSTLQHHEYIHEWKSVERNTMHQTQHTSFLSIRQMRMEKTLKDDTSWTADCSLFFSPLRKGKKIKKCKRKHQRLSKKIHLQCYLKCKNEKLQTQTAFRRHS